MQRYRITEEQIARARVEWPLDENKVAAIKIVRTATGCGLRVAKTFVESDYDTTLEYEDKGEEWVKFTTNESVKELMARLFDLTAEISAIHRKLEKIDD